MNDWLVQFQADISAIEVVRPVNLETTALGAAYLAGIAAGLWTIGEVNEKWRIDRLFHGTLSHPEIASLKQQWYKAVARAKNWTEYE